MKVFKDVGRIGVIGLFLTALFSPCCFPIFAFVASALGLGSFEVFGGWTMIIFQVMVVISLLGFYFSYRKHRCTYPLLIAVPSSLLIFLSYNFDFGKHWIYFLYVGMLGLLIATIVNWYRNKLHGNCNTCVKIDGKTVELESLITCPECGHKKLEIMPTDACTYFYECENCKVRLRPKHGDCCVYCSYGSIPCPPIQMDEKCC